MLVDLHAHSHLTHTCELTPARVLERAATLGLDGVAFTERNTQDGFEELFEAAEGREVQAFVGLELHTDRGQYLCFFPEPEKAPEPVQRWGWDNERPWRADVCLPELHEMGAAIVAARPFDRQVPNPALDYILSLELLCAVEAYNPRVNPQANAQALSAAAKLGVRAVAGSDARDSLDEVGKALTLFKEPVRGQRAFVEALLEGVYWPVAVGDASLPDSGDSGGGGQRGKKRGSKRSKRGR